MEQFRCEREASGRRAGRSTMEGFAMLAQSTLHNPSPLIYSHKIYVQKIGLFSG